MNGQQYGRKYPEDGRLGSITLFDGQASRRLNHLDIGVGEGSMLSPSYFSCGMSDASMVSKRAAKALEGNTKFE